MLIEEPTMDEKAVNKPMNDEYVIKVIDNGEKVTMHDLHQVLLPLMDDIHRVCVMHDIQYALMAGSALGIHNYGGFIPWDDDIDVCILRKDWLRFIDALKKDLNPNYYFQCFETDKKYNVMIPPMKIRIRNTYIEEVNVLLKNRCLSGDGVYIDVDMFDHVSGNKFIDELFRFPIRFMMPVMVLLDNIGINPVWFKKASLAISAFYSKRNQDSRYIFETISIPWEKFLKKPVFLKEDILPFKLYEFEGRHFYSFNKLENVLIARYGKQALKKWDGQKWVDPYPESKRVPKHVRDIRLTEEKK
jgi:lipopolysaccharide cholinephosphotransferase